MFSLFISPSDVFIETKPQFFSGGGTILPLQNRPLLQSNILNGSLRIFGTCSVLGHLLFSINMLSQDRLLYLLKRRCRLSLHHSNCRTTSHLSCSAEYHILLVPAQFHRLVISPFRDLGILKWSRSTNPISTTK